MLFFTRNTLFSHYFWCYFGVFFTQLGLPAEALTKYQELAALIITLGSMSETVKSETIVKGVTPSAVTAATAGSSKLATEQR
jgi:hypothetical protein